MSFSLANGPTFLCILGKGRGEGAPFFLSEPPHFFVSPTSIIFYQRKDDNLRIGGSTGVSHEQCRLCGPGGVAWMQGKFSYVAWRIHLYWSNPLLQGRIASLGRIPWREKHSYCHFYWTWDEDEVQAFLQPIYTHPIYTHDKKFCLTTEDLEKGMTMDDKLNTICPFFEHMYNLYGKYLSQKASHCSKNVSIVFKTIALHNFLQIECSS